MSALEKQETILDYSTVAAINVTMYLNVSHEIGLPYPPSHSDIDILLHNEVRGDAVSVLDELFRVGFRENLPLVALVFEKVEEIDVQRITVK